jgi:TRAP-type uncharacterized transport system substrate-binding protein
VLGLAAVAVVLAVDARTPRPPARALSLSPGPLTTSRALIARELAEAAAHRGLEIRLVEVPSAAQELHEFESGQIDLALVSGAYVADPQEHLREVTPLYVEALHLLVRRELAPAVGVGLGGLRGLGVDLGPPGSTNAALARSVLAFAGLPADEAGTTHELELAELVARGERGEWSALPDAIFHLGTVPSTIALRLLRSGRYELVPLPFADAFRLGRLLSDASLLPAPARIDRDQVVDTVVPPFTYGVDPPDPPEPLHTLGTPLLLVGHASVPSDSIELLLEAVFESRFARSAQPWLHRSVLEAAPRFRHHSGTRAYLARYRPFVTGSEIDKLNNSLGIAGALVGGLLFAWQWRRQRVRDRLDAAVGDYLLRVADLERRIAALELSASLELEPLAELRRELLQLKSEALERFAAGELGSHATIADLLTPINSARDQIADLILHVRENLEQQAEAEGRSAGALWSEAIEGGEGNEGGEPPSGGGSGPR